MKRRRVETGQPQARGPRPPGVEDFRREVIALHREIFKRNQARINASISGYTKSFRAYERDYARGVRTYARRASVDELARKMASASVVYVGDYHTLPQAQRSFLRLVRRLPKTRQVTMALEFVPGRYQRIIDAFMADQIDEPTFLRSIRRSGAQVADTWPSFKPIFDLARERHHRIIGIDSDGRGGGALAARDRYAARRIAQAWRAHPDRLVMVLMGELHVAPCHLPKQVQQRFADLGEPLTQLVIYQNCEQIYARLEERGLEHDVTLVLIRKGEYCLINTPPIVCQQSFLNWLYVDEDGAQIDEPEQTFREYVRLIASFFDLPVGDAVDEVELTTVVDLSFLSRLRRRGDFSARDVRMIRKQILATESYYIPRANMVYLGNLSVNHVSEEATHFLRHVCASQEDPKLLVDAFYARCLEEALGFLGSKIINHKRKGPTLDDFRRLRRQRTATAEERALARAVLLHARMEDGERVRGMASLYECDATLFNMITHILGYRLGERLYYGLVRGHMSKTEVRDLFFDTFEEEGTALATYLYILARTAGVQAPAHF